MATWTDDDYNEVVIRYESKLELPVQQNPLEEEHLAFLQMQLLPKLTSFQ